MADQTTELTPEEEAEVRDLLYTLERPASDYPFSPMEEQFRQEIRELTGFQTDEATEAEFPTEEGEPTFPEPEMEIPEGLANLVGAIEESKEISPEAEEMEPAPLAEMDEIGGLEDLLAPEETPSDSEEMGELGGLDDLLSSEEEFALPAEEPAAEALSDLGDLGGLEDFALPAEEPAEEALSDLGDLGGLEDFALPAEEAPSDLGDLGGLEDFALPAEEAPSDLGDLGGLDDFTLPAEEPAEAPGDLGDLGGLEDFALPAEEPAEEGLEDLLGGFEDISAPVEEPAIAASEEISGGLDDLNMSFGADDLSATGFEEPTSPQPIFEAGEMETGETGAIPGGLLDMGDLHDMTQQAQLQSGIGDEYSDEDLATIRARINEYPPGLKRAIIDTVVNEKIPADDQRLLMKLIGENATPNIVADFLKERIGYRPDITPSRVRKDGVEIIYADELSPDLLARKKQRAKLILIAATGLLSIVLTGFLGSYLYRKFSIKGMYESGLEELHLASLSSGEQREQHKKNAETYYTRALTSDGKYSLEYLNRYGIAYMKAGYFDEAFVKLFGLLEKDYDWSSPNQRAPLIRLSDNSRWYGPSEQAMGQRSVITASDNVSRKVIIPGAYIVSRIRDRGFDRTTNMNLGRFHSHTAPDFANRSGRKEYKNDSLAIDYYRLILTLMNMPDDTEAMAGIGKVYYNRNEFGAAARQYNKILDIAPMDVSGHAGLLHTYIEIWKTERDPRFVIQRHRLVQKLGLEDDLPIYLLTKLAGFYIDLDRDDLRIKYQVDPHDALSGLNIKDNAINLLEITFKKEEMRDERVIEGSTYGEGFYQRGRFLVAQKENLRALRQFQNAHNYDDRNYLAVNAMGEYYMHVMDFKKAEEYFSEAIKTYNRYSSTYGIYPEDETLQEGDPGKLYYNLGSLLFLRYAGMDPDSTEGFPDTRIYPDRAGSPEAEEMTLRRERLREANRFFDRAMEMEMRDPSARLINYFRMGWIEYMNGDFQSALRKWDELETIYDYNYQDPVLLLARGNAYYYTDQTRSALGNYLKLQNDYERKVASIEIPNTADSAQKELYLTLSAVYNNIGAVYEKEYLTLKSKGGSPSTLANLEKDALLHYWKAVESSRIMNVDNEISRANIQLAFKPDGAKEGREPLLDDWISPKLSSEVAKK